MNTAPLCLMCTVVVAAMAGQAGTAQSPASMLIGPWRLLSYDTRDGQGRIDHPLGTHVVGQLVYDARGNMAVQIMREDRPRFASDDFAHGADPEVRAALEGYVAYFGTYTVDPVKRTVTHTVRGALFPNFVNSQQVRSYTLSGDRLSLSTPPILWQGTPLEFVLVWERLPS
jgi:hypothetical protein